MEYNFVERVIREQAVIAAARDLQTQIDLLVELKAYRHGLNLPRREVLRAALTALDELIDLTRSPIVPDGESDEYGA